jgi:hypothetical protein
MTHKKAETKQDTPTRIRLGRLDSPISVAKFMARVLKTAARGGNVNDAYKLTVMASQLLHATEVANLERRIEQLEQKIPGKK